MSDCYPRPRLVSVGTAVPPFCYSQDEIADLLAVEEGLCRRFFATAGVASRSLYLQPQDGRIPEEDQGSLLERHRCGSLELGGEAIGRCLKGAGVTAREVDFLCCVSSTGFMLPGLSAMYIKHLGFRHDCQRIDIVGMGCNAALNALNAAAGWTVSNEGRIALVVCCEINSAVHVRDNRVVTALVNSLFGDGCGALLLSSRRDFTVGPQVLGFASHIEPESWRAISYHWSREHGKFELFLDRLIPTVLGEHAPTPISALLEKFGLCRCDIKHWLVHAGGPKVISAVGASNGLSPHDTRHSTSILAKHGNLGSATVVFSYEGLLAEAAVSPGDFGVMVTMGPGTTVETALLQW